MSGFQGQDNEICTIIKSYNFTNDYSPVLLVHVRPETNAIEYESPIAEVFYQYDLPIAYLSNLNGRLFIYNALVLDHYYTRFQFATYAKLEMQKYPIMIKKFERHFGEKFDNSHIIGSFDAQIEFNMNANELYNIIVSAKDMLNLYGQVIKRISYENKTHYIVNCNLPAIFNKYTPNANIFVIAVNFHENVINFQEIKNAIMSKYYEKKKVLLTEKEQIMGLTLENKLKRMLHISNNHLTSMFDMIDYIYLTLDGNTGKVTDFNQIKQISFELTPLGKYLIDHGISDIQLNIIKKNRVVYLKNKHLIYLPHAAQGKSMEQILQLIKDIDWQIYENQES